MDLRKTKARKAKAEVNTMTQKAFVKEVVVISKERKDFLFSGASDEESIFWKKQKGSERRTTKSNR